jgi:hypothetical protein
MLFAETDLDQGARLPEPLGASLQWPTLLILAMFPVLVFMYVRLARGEELEALAEFGVAYGHYVREVPGFIPQIHRRRSTWPYGPKRRPFLI